MVADPTRAEVMIWRKATRERLIAARLAVSAEQRAAWSAAISGRLMASLGTLEGAVVSVYWPFRGEPDLRAFMAGVASRGGACALPVVVEKGRPLIFRRWREGEPLVRGVWNIPVPAQGAEVVPAISIAPVVGFDRQCYRLGYGGGFFDRTLEALHPRPRVLGVGYALQALASIHPLAHDIPMQAIVTEDAVHAPI